MTKLFTSKIAITISVNRGHQHVYSNQGHFPVGVVYPQPAPALPVHRDDISSAQYSATESFKDDADVSDRLPSILRKAVDLVNPEFPAENLDALVNSIVSLNSGTIESQGIRILRGRTPWVTNADFQSNPTDDEENDTWTLRNFIWQFQYLPEVAEMIQTHSNTNVDDVKVLTLSKPVAGVSSFTKVKS